jgi:hypothetical protein
MRKIEEIFHSIRTKIIEKRKMVENYGAQYEQGRAGESALKGKLLENIV